MRQQGSDQGLASSPTEVTRLVIETGSRYDVVFDAVDKLADAYGRQALKPGGVYLNVDKSSDNCQLTPEDLLFLKELAEAGRLKAIIDRRYPLAQVPDAIRYSEEGRARGKIIIDVD